MLLLMASTVFLHSDSFLARTDVIFPFVVPLETNEESWRGAYILAPFIPATIRLMYMQLWSRHLSFPFLRDKRFAKLFCSPFFSFVSYVKL